MTDLEEPGSGISEPPRHARHGRPHARTGGTGDGAAGAGSTSQGGQASRGGQAKPRSRGMSALRESVIVLGTALVLSLLIKTFLVQSFYIPSESMEPALIRGDRVMVSRLVPGPFDLHRGDVVVFVDPGGWLTPSTEPSNPVRDALIAAGEFIGLLPSNTGSHLIKRVIGLPGDTVTCCDAEGRLMVNGVPIDEPYVIDGAVPSERTFEVVVPDGNLWVMGDNRPNSADSRVHVGKPGGGWVPIDNVVGVAQLRIWPFDRWGVLRNPGDTFADVPDPVP